MKVKNKQNNKLLKQRQDMVLGVILAVVTGFVVSIIGNIVYDVFFLPADKAIHFKDINQNGVSFILFIIIFIESFLEFLLIDYNNGDEYNKSFWKRFYYFTKEKHWSVVTGKKITQWAIITFKWLFLFSFLISAFTSKSWILFWIIVIITVATQFKKYYENKK